MTPANLLTILRIALVPVFVILLVYGYMGGALLVFLLAGATDGLDGLIARRFNQKTPLGAFLDPMADKLLLVSSFVILSLSGLPLYVRIPLWLTITVISRDIILVMSVTIINLAVGRRVFYPSIFGKATTASQLLTILVALTANYRNAGVFFLKPLFYITLVLTVISGVHYIVRGIRILEEQRQSL